MKKFSKAWQGGEFIIFAALLGLLILAGFFSVTCGTWPIGARDAIQIALSKLGLYRTFLPEAETAIVWDGRIPRYIVGILVGFSLGAAGAIMQG